MAWPILLTASSSAKPSGSRSKHYQLLSGGRSQLVRPPAVHALPGLRQRRARRHRRRRGRARRLCLKTSLPPPRRNDFVNQLRDEVRMWRDGRLSGHGARHPPPARMVVRAGRRAQGDGPALLLLPAGGDRDGHIPYEVQNRRKMPETGDLLRYALKLATGTGKTVVMALLVTWSTLHKRKVSGSTLSANFLVLVPNLTVRDRVSGVPRGDGLEPGGRAQSLQRLRDGPAGIPRGIPARTSWSGTGNPFRLKPSATTGLEKRSSRRVASFPPPCCAPCGDARQQDPNAVIQRMLRNWRDVFVINDEAHHVYGEKKARKGEEPEFIKWSKILDRIAKATRVSLVVDLSATPWYGSGSPKPEGTLFEWLVSRFFGL